MVRSDYDETDTQSLSAEVSKFYTEYGRSYHSTVFQDCRCTVAWTDVDSTDTNSAYLFPNDEIEKDRMDMLHAIFKMIHHDKLHFAPLRDPKRILDLGTGTGIWPIEMCK